MNPVSEAIIVKNLVKRYDGFTALDHVDLTVAIGECFGSLGPNGAGKTTLIRILTGLLHPTEGEAIVAGEDVAKRPDAVRRAIGVVSQAMTTDLDLTGWENLDIYGKYYQVPEKERRERIRELIERVGLTERADDLVAAYSGGMRRRLEIARGLIHRPKILFLDEPTIGLDVSMQSTIRAFIREYNERFRATIMLTSHYMEDVAALCPRVIVIHQGRLIHDGALGDLVRSIRPDKRLVLRLSREVAAADLAALGTVLEQKGLGATLSVERSRLADTLARAASMPIVDLSVEDPPLEDVMRDLFARQDVPPAPAPSPAGAGVEGQARG